VIPDCRQTVTTSTLISGYFRIPAICSTRKRLRFTAIPIPRHTLPPELNPVLCANKMGSRPPCDVAACPLPLPCVSF